MEIWAHRGRSVSRESGNSAKSFISCYNLGITGIEADVCLTRDYKIIIYHPGTFEPDLVNMTWSDIKQSHFGNILSLEDFLDLLEKFKGLRCSLDMKQNSIVLAAMTAREIAKRGMENRVYLSAFQKSIPSLAIESDGSMLVAAKKYYPNIKTHLMILFPFDLTGLVDEYNPDLISFGWLQEPPLMKVFSRTLFKSIARLVNLKKQIAEVQSGQVKVLGGVINDPADILYFKNLGVDGIVTDRPIIGMGLI